MDYRFALKKGGRKLQCPRCGKSTFVPYADKATGQTADVKIYGRCERINSCAYHSYPINDGKWSDYVAPAPAPPKPLDFVPRGTVEATFTNFNQNVFFLFLVDTFGKEAAFELQARYNIGTAKHGGTIFWQQDSEGRFRTGKVIYYARNGKRDKNRASWFVHKAIDAEFNFRQCFFGLHLVDDAKPVALCESEKTAILMTVFDPAYTWIASGGSELLNIQRLGELPRLDKVFPDEGQFAKWEEKTKHFNRKMDITVEQAVARGDIPQGSDILDLYLLTNNQP